MKTKPGKMTFLETGTKTATLKPAKPETKKITIRIKQHSYNQLRKLHGEQKIKSVTAAIDEAIDAYLKNRSVKQP